MFPSSHFTEIAEEQAKLFKGSWTSKAQEYYDRFIEYLSSKYNIRLNPGISGQYEWICVTVSDANA